ncbi:MAG: DUF2752 domain-containing protein [Actinomycetales bacterium]|nr:DUF2752 domain-containing protein [Actinomycetales bacterium]
MPISRRRALGVGVTAAAIVGAHVGGALFFAGHDPYQETVFPPCPWLTLTGWQCPACGGTRAAFSLFHGDLAQSWQLNPAVLMIYVAGVLVALAVAAIWTGRDRAARILTWTVPVVLGATLAYTGIIRNLLGG